MPDGIVHDRITFWLLLPVFLACFVVTRDWLLCSICGLSFVFSGLMFNGDLDTYSNPYKRWWLLRFIWYPYQKLSSHRSYWSHGPIMGTVGRLLWLGLICSPLLWYYGEQIESYIIVYRVELLWCLIGLELGSLSHSISDWLS